MLMFVSVSLIIAPGLCYLSYHRHVSVTLLLHWHIFCQLISMFRYVSVHLYIAFKVFCFEINDTWKCVSANSVTKPKCFCHFSDDTERCFCHFNNYRYFCLLKNHTKMYFYLLNYFIEHASISSITLKCVSVSAFKCIFVSSATLLNGFLSVFILH